MTELATAPYKIGLRDHNAFVAIWLRRSVFSQRHFLRFVLMTCVLCLIAVFQTHQFSIGLPFMFVATILAIAMILSATGVYLIWPLLVWLWQIIGWALNPLRPRTQSLRIVEDGLEKTVDGESHVYAWDRFSDYSEDRKRALLFLGPNSAVILPKSAFATPVEAAAFTAALSARIHRKPHKDPAQNF